MDGVNRGVADLLGGTSATCTPEGGDPVEVTGNFDEAYQRLDIGTPGVSTTTPSLFLVLSDLPSDPAEVEYAIEVAGQEFRVREVQKDGQGGVRLLLHKVI